MAKLRTVKAWAVFIKSDGMIDCDGAKPMVSLARKPMDETAKYCITAKVVPVRIVPEAEYKRMMAAVRYVEAIAAGKGADVRFKLGGEYMKAKRKAVNRGK